MVTVIVVTGEDKGDKDCSEGYGEEEEGDCDRCGKQAQIEGGLGILQFAVVFFLRKLFVLQFVVEETLALVVLTFAYDVGKYGDGYDQE